MTDPTDRIDTPDQPQRIDPLEEPQQDFSHQTAIKGLIFDMDGTIIDSIQQDYEAWNKTFEPYDISIPYEKYVKQLGAKGEEIVRKHIDISEEEAKEFTKKKDEHFQKDVEENGLKAMLHIEPILEQARKLNMKIALATGSKMDKLDMVFKHVDLRDYFDEIITADHVENGKPNGEVFEKAAKQLGLSPHEVLVWEDATLGVQAAKNAQMKCVCITTTQKGDHKGLEEADVLIDTYEGIDLQKLIHAIA